MALIEKILGGGDDYNPSNLSSEGENVQVNEDGTYSLGRSEVKADRSDHELYQGNADTIRNFLDARPQDVDAELTVHGDPDGEVEDAQYEDLESVVGAFETYIGQPAREEDPLQLYLVADGEVDEQEGSLSIVYGDIDQVEYAEEWGTGGNVPQSGEELKTSEGGFPERIRRTGTNSGVSVKDEVVSPQVEMEVNWEPSVR